MGRVTWRETLVTGRPADETCEWNVREILQGGPPVVEHHIRHWVLRKVMTMPDRMHRMNRYWKEMESPYNGSNEEGARLFAALADMARGVPVEDAIVKWLSEDDARLQALFRELASVYLADA